MNELLRFLHIGVASAWLGATLWVAGDVRRTLALGRPDADALSARVSPALSLDLALGFATVLTGLGVLFWQSHEAGIPAHPGTGIMIGFALTLVRIAIVAFGLRPAWRAVAARLSSGEAVAASEKPVRRMAMFSGIGHTLWLLALASMVF